MFIMSNGDRDEDFSLYAVTDDTHNFTVGSVENFGDSDYLVAFPYFSAAVSWIIRWLSRHVPGCGECFDHVDWGWPPPERAVLWL